MEGNTGFLTLLMTVIGPLLLGLGILYLVLRTRRVDWRQRQQTEAATEDLYDRTDEARERQERLERAEQQR